jgi:hypothetical protein
MESVICTRATKSSLEKNEGSTELSRRQKARTNWMPIILIAMLVVTIFLIIPFVRETDIHVQIGSADNIVTVWVDTPYKPLISHLFPLSYPLSAYTIIVTIIGPVNANLVQTHVPIGEIVLLWQNGVPTTGNYTVEVTLFSLQGLKDTYYLNVSF